jgi:hypothetical protein
MSGGITQLVATGVQDMYLSGTPEISFFRSSYKRYTHFASNVERQLIQGNPSPSGVSTIRFEKKGDLLSHVYLTALDTNVASNVNVNWSTIISKLELMIGGQIIDTQDFTWTSNIEPVYGAQTFSNRASKKDAASSVFFPLKFFFCKDWQNALPLVALQYHDVEIRITWANPSAGDQYAVWTRFIYLDKDEREWFAKQKHDMLIQQITRVPMSDKSTYEFALSQPIKYIAFESNSYTNVYNTNLPLVNTSTTVQVLVNPGTQPTYLNLQALTPIFQGPSYISAVSGNDVTISYQSQTAVPVPQGLMIDLAPVVLTSQGTIASSATLTSFTLNFTGNLVALYGSGFYATGAGALVAAGQATPIVVTAVAAPVYSAITNLSSVTFTCTSVNLVASIANPVITFVPTGFTALTTTSALTTTAAASTQSVIPYTTSTLTVGQQVALPQITGQATITSSNATTFTLSYISQIVPTIPSGQQFFVLPSNIFTDTAYTPVSLNQGSQAASYMQFKMQINGNDIGESRHLPHWQEVNQYYLSPFGYDSPNPNNVVIIPFCLDTSKLQPTGTLNFSRIDTFRLLTPVQTNFQQLSRFGAGSYFYAVNYNILRIQNGMAGILYSS